MTLVFYQLWVCRKGTNLWIFFSLQKMYLILTLAVLRHDKTRRFLLKHVLYPCFKYTKHNLNFIFSDRLWGILPSCQQNKLIMKTACPFTVHSCPKAILSKKWFFYLSIGNQVMKTTCPSQNYLSLTGGQPGKSNTKFSQKIRTLCVITLFHSVYLCCHNVPAKPLCSW